jgi:hypothetical protein
VSGVAGGFGRQPEPGLILGLGDRRHRAKITGLSGEVTEQPEDREKAGTVAHHMIHRQD